MTGAGRSPEVIEDQVEYQVCRHSGELEETARGAQRLVYGIDTPSPGCLVSCIVLEDLVEL